METVVVVALETALALGVTAVQADSQAVGAVVAVLEPLAAARAALEVTARSSSSGNKGKIHE